MQLGADVLQPVSVGVGAGEPRGDLGAEHRLGHDAERVEEHSDVEAPVMEELGDRRVREQRDQVGRLRLARRDLDHVGGAVAWRDLHHAQPVAMRVEPQRLGVDRHRRTW